MADVGGATTLPVTGSSLRRAARAVPRSSNPGRSAGGAVSAEAAAEGAQR